MCVCVCMCALPIVNLKYNYIIKQQRGKIASNLISKKVLKKKLCIENKHKFTYVNYEVGIQ